VTGDDRDGNYTYTIWKEKDFYAQDDAFIYSESTRKYLYMIK